MATDETGQQDPKLPPDARLDSLEQRLERAQRIEAKRTFKAQPDPAHRAGQLVLSHLVGAPLGGGLIGWGLDHWLGTSFLVVIGMNSIAAYLIAHLFVGFISDSFRIHLGPGWNTLAGPPYAHLIQGAAVLLTAFTGGMVALQAPINSLLGRSIGTWQAAALSAWRSRVPSSRARSTSASIDPAPLARRASSAANASAGALSARATMSGNVEAGSSDAGVCA